jgi:hypothetical protein
VITKILEAPLRVFQVMSNSSGNDKVELFIQIEIQDILLFEADRVRIRKLWSAPARGK